MQTAAWSTKQKKWIEVSNAKDVSPDVGASLLSQMKELKESEAVFHKQVTELKTDKENLEGRIKREAESLYMEGLELHARISRINNRLAALGFKGLASNV